MTLTQPTPQSPNLAAVPNEPLLVSDPFIENSLTMTIESRDLYNEPYVRIVNANNEELILPFDYLPALSRYQNQMRWASHEARDRLKREHNNPAAEGGPCVDAGKYVALPDADVTVEGTPVLMWQDESADNGAGWRLLLIGGGNITIGFAAWDDADGINSLVGTLSDPDTVITMAGMVAPTETAHLSARITTATLKANRDLPAVALPKVRKVLQDAGVSRKDAVEDHTKVTARMRSLAVKIADKKIPIAVAIVPERVPYGVPALTVTESRMTYSERNDLVEERSKKIREKFTVDAKKALTAAGWRVVELPQPYMSWGNRGSTAFWVTLVKPEDWSGIAAVAHAEAAKLEMSRGGAL